MADEARLRIRPLSPHDDLTDLRVSSADEDDLKSFLVDSAAIYMRERLAFTYVLVERLLSGRDKVVGYVSLLTSVLDTGRGVTLMQGIPGRRDSDDPRSEFTYPYAFYPAIKIARLLVDADYRRLGFGQELVDLAIDIAEEAIGGVIGCRFVVVDAKPEAVDFWRHFGFSELATAGSRRRTHTVLFYDLIHTPRHDPPPLLGGGRPPAD